MIQIIDSVKRLFGMFDSRGLRYSTYHLESIRKEITKWPVEKQARYADQICVESCNNGVDLLIPLPTTFDLIMLKPESVNTTSIGNIAYISLYSKFPNRRLHAKCVLDFLTRNL